MATITVMKNYVIKKAQGTSDENLKKIVKVLKNYNKLDAESKKKVGSAVEKLYTKFKAQESKKSTPRAGTTPKSTGKKKLSTQDLKSAIAKFKEKVGAKTWKQATSGTSIKEDAERPALPKGKRYSKITGNPYWESRANRSDVKQPPKTYPRLAKGGDVEEAKYLKSDGVSQSIVSNKKEATPMWIMDAEYYISSNPKKNAIAIAEKIDKSLPDRVGKNYIVKIVSKQGEKFAKGGYLGKNDEDVWNGWSVEQRKHFLKDHRILSGKTEEHRVSLYRYDELPKDLLRKIKPQLIEHISEGQYAKGGEIKHWKYDVILITPTEEHHVAKFHSLGDARISASALQEATSTKGYKYKVKEAE